MKRTWKDGTTHIVLTPQVLIERLLALVPRPRRHQLTYYGVLAPAAGLRSRVVPQRELGDEVGAVAGAPSVPAGVEADHGDRSPKRDLVPHRPAARRRGVKRRYTWASLLRRVFLVDVLQCPHCGGARRLLAALVHESQRCSRRQPIPGFPDPVTSHAEHRVPCPSQVQDEVSSGQLG